MKRALFLLAPCVLALSACATTGTSAGVDPPRSVIQHVGISPADFYKAERVYNVAAKVVIAGIERGIIPSSAFPTIRDLNAKATVALRVGKVAADTDDLTILSVQHAALLDITTRLLNYAVP